MASSAARIGLRRCRSRSLFLFGIVVITFAVWPHQLAQAQEWQWKATVQVGNGPERAAISADGHEVYVANRESCSISRIDTQSNNSVTEIPLSKTPKAIVATNDGKRIYILAEDIDPSDPKKICHPAPNEFPKHYWLGFIEPGQTAVQSWINLPGERWDEMTFAHDGKLYLAEVLDGETRYAGAVYAFDPAIGELEPTPVIRDETGCPTGVAVSDRYQRIYVSYQCGGPGGSLAHDGIGVYDLSSRQLIATISKIPNVGGQLALSPDQSQLWIGGNDACSRLDYPVEDCPTVPARVVNVIGVATTDPKPLKTYAFSLEDFNGRISFLPGPNITAFVGGGIYLKEIDTKNLVPVGDVKRLPIANIGDVVFSPDGATAYLAATDENAMYVMSRARTGDYAHVQDLTLPTVVGVLGTHGSYGQCVEKPNNERDTNCFRVAPQDFAPELLTRTTAEDPLHHCGYPRNQPDKSHAEVYRCVANAILAEAIAGKIDKGRAVEWAMDLRALEANEENVEWRVDFTEYSRLRELPETKLTPIQKQELADLSKAYKDAEHDDSRAFNDVTMRLHDPQKLREALGDSAAILGVFSYRDRSPQQQVSSHVYTILISKDTQIIQDDGVDWDTLQEKAQGFLRAVSTQSEHRPPVESKGLYDVLIGENTPVAGKLKTLGGQSKPTLVWVMEDDLRHVPMAALSPDGESYLAEKFSNVVLTTPSAPEEAENQDTWRGLAVADATGALYDVGNEIRSLFSDQQPAASTKMRAKILLNEGQRKEFTNIAFSTGLQDLQKDEGDTNRIVFIASDFALMNNERDSFLRTADSAGLPLVELSHEDKYPLRGVSLVTFSACQTAAESNGREVEGLAYQLDERGNGARAVLATLWKIDPTNSTPLMKTFDAALQQGHSKAESLRQAEVYLINEKRPPRYWASFILIGDWR